MPATTFSTEKKKGGSYKLDATAVTALGALDTTNDISDVLDVLSALTARAHTVAAGQIGKATSVLS